jgi:hypothetical protein
MTNAREEGESSGNTALPSKALATGASALNARTEVTQVADLLGARFLACRDARRCCGIQTVPIMVLFLRTRLAHGTSTSGQSCRASRAEAESRRKAAELHGKKDDKPDSNTPRRRTRSPLSP